MTANPLNAEALLPCPFCGGEPVTRRTVRGYSADVDGPAGEYDEAFAIACDECGVSVHDEYRDGAAACWNRRALPSVQTERVTEAALAVLVEAKTMAMTMRRRKIFNDLEAALAHEPAAEWRPIEEAPHNCAVLLGWHDWRDGQWCTAVGAASWGERVGEYSNRSRHGSATHWRPLPPPPEVQP